jgi:hypothetical protein
MASGDLTALAAQAAGFYSAAGNFMIGSGNTINIPEGFVNVGGNGKGYVQPAVTNFNPLTEGNNDGSFAAFALGVDYYIYACQQSTGCAKPITSINSTYPTSYTAANSRKVSGFHYARKRNSITIADVTSGCIVPNSVWDLNHRPRCSPEGMVDTGDGTWVDIYNVSVDEAITFASGNGSPLLTGSCKSAYNAVPLTGTEGLNGYNFVELARRSGKRLLTLSEWLATAHGSPQGNNGDNVNAWSATTNAARQNTGYVPNAISLLNAVDCVGNVYEWLSDIVSNPTGTSPAWFDVMSGMSVGQLYMHSTAGVFQVLAGGSWYIGILAGSRCTNFSNYPWLVDASAGCRFACDTL